MPSTSSEGGDEHGSCSRGGLHAKTTTRQNERGMGDLPAPQSSKDRVARICLSNVTVSSSKIVRYGSSSRCQPSHPLIRARRDLKKSSQILGISRLRGLAALVVVFMHCVMVLPVDLSAAPFYASGYYGVSLFFAISGFLITTNILRRYGTVGAVNVSDFYVMRAARILPCLTLLIVLLSVLAIVRYPGFAFEEGSSLGKANWSVLTLSFNKLGMAVPLGWAVLWYLSIEEAFYVLYPVIAIVLRKEKVLIGVLLLVIVYGISGRTTPGDLFTYRCCFDLIAMGALAAIAAHRPKAPQWSLVWAKWLGAVITLSAYLFLPVREHVTVGPSLIALGGVMMLYALKVEEDRATRPQRLSLLGTIGECSYELYLFHYSVFVLVASGLTGIFGGGSYISVAVALVTALCVSLAVQRYLSDPLNARIRELFVRRTPAAASRQTMEVLGPPATAATRQ
jgi:peptidoglycan/LPS O-acetylase OafA/YrhL